MAKLIMIEDDLKLGELVKTYLERNGHVIHHALRPSIGLEKINTENYDLLVLDIMLPEMDGFEVLKRIRVDNDLPVIMLTARSDVNDRIVGLELGADDYLAKPFEPRELLARIDSILRRSHINNSDSDSAIFKAKGLEVNFERREAFFKDENMDLTTAEFELLSLFIEQKGKALSRDDIMNGLQGIDSNVFSRSIDILVSRLRQKLGDNSKESNYIKTIWGKGYMFIGADS
jgi:OmpR family response regulator RpaB